MDLKENERIDDLEFEDLKIIQNTKGFCFGIDSVLLSDFAKNIKKNSTIVDLGTGTGIISILLSKKTEAKKIYGIELQEEVCDMASRSVLLNNLQDKIEIINKNIKNISDTLGINVCDVVVTNPPYKKYGTGLLNEDDSKIISRHEKECTLEDVIKQSFKILKDKGLFYMVHRPDRLVDILNIMRKYKLEPKNIRFIYPSIDKSPKLVLIKGIKNAKPFLKIDKPLIVYKS